MIHDPCRVVIHSIDRFVADRLLHFVISCHQRLTIHHSFDKQASSNSLTVYQVSLPLKPIEIPTQTEPTSFHHVLRQRIHAHTPQKVQSHHGRSHLPRLLSTRNSRIGPRRHRSRHSHASILQRQRTHLQSTQGDRKLSRQTAQDTQLRPVQVHYCVEGARTQLDHFG